MEKLAKTLVIILAVIEMFVFSAAGFFFGKSVERKKYRQYGSSETVIDTVYVTKTKVMAKIQTVYSKPDSIIVTETDTIYIDKPVKYEIATIDTTFNFSNNSWHKLQISYDELKNEFFLDSTFRLYETISIPTISDVNPKKSASLRPFLVASWALGEDDNKKYSTLGMGVGIKYKNTGIGVCAFSNKTAGGMLSYDF